MWRENGDYVPNILIDTTTHAVVLSSDLFCGPQAIANEADKGQTTLDLWLRRGEMRKMLRSSVLLAVLAVVLGCCIPSQNTYAKNDNNSIQPVQSLTVFDGRGKKVGSVLGFLGANPIVALRVGGELAILSLYGTRIMIADRGPCHFPSCFLSRLIALVRHSSQEESHSPPHPRATFSLDPTFTFPMGPLRA